MPHQPVHPPNLDRRPSGRRPGHSACTGLTLLELLISLIIVVLCLAMLLPAAGAAREAARRAHCQSNLRNLGLSVQQYVSVHRRFPPAASFRVGQRPDGVHDPPRHSVFVYLLPFLENGALVESLDVSRDWNAKVNVALTRQHLGGVLACPSAPGDRHQYHTSDYCPAIHVDPSESSGIGRLIRSDRVRNRSRRPGPDWGRSEPAWDNVLQLTQVDYRRGHKDRRVVRPREVRDGMSHTLLMVEDAGKPFCYRQGRRSTCQITRFRWASPNLWMSINDSCNEVQLVNCCNNSQPYAFHSAGLNTVYADGSVHYLVESISPDVFISRITMAAGD